MLKDIADKIDSIVPLPLAALFFANLLWGSSFVGMKFAFGYYNHVVILFGRLTIASLTFLLFLKKWNKFNYLKGDWKYLLLMGSFEPCLYFLFESYALKNTTSSQAGMITAMLPLFVAIFSFFLLKEKISLKTLIGLIISISGVVWISLISPSSKAAPNPVLGNSLEIIAMLFASGYTVTLKHLSTRYTALQLTAIQSITGMIFFFCLLFTPMAVIPKEFNIIPVLVMLYLGVLVSGLAYLMYNYGVGKISASQASSFCNLIPVFGIIMGWVFLDETLNFSQFCGVILVFVGVIICQQKKTLNPVQDEKTNRDEFKTGTA